jgi:putative endonuclease
MPLSFIPFWRGAEIRAAKYLRSQGYLIVASGFRVREGEVDLIAWDGEILVFIEVKSRKGPAPPEAAVGFTKQQRVIRAARAYIARHRLHETTYRFDIVAVNEPPGEVPTYRLLRDAFRPRKQHL